MLVRNQKSAIDNLNSRGSAATCFLLTTGCRLLTTVSVILAVLFIAGGVSKAQDVTADLSENGVVRIKNTRGGVQVDVWNERNVSIKAVVEGAEPRRSPIVIQRTENFLSISISSAVPASQRVNLELRVPARSLLEITSNDGGVTVKGSPKAISVLTVSGDIRFEAAELNNALVSMQTTSGNITSPKTSSEARSDRGNSVQYRTGDGSTSVRLRSGKGSIFLITEGGDTAAGSDKANSDKAKPPPTLIGAAGGKPSAGTPANPSSSPEELDEGDTVRVDTEIVTMNVSVVDRGTSRGLTGLTQSDFRLYEDNAEQQINHFESSGAPFDLVLLIDLSGSTREVVKLIRAAAQSFVDAARPADNIAIITFARAPVLVSSLTNDRTLLRQRIDTIDTAEGDTKLYDSIDFAMSEALKGSGKSRRTAIVVMSDGLDGTLPSVKGDGSKIDYKELLGRVQEFDGVVYTIWLDTTYESLSDEDTQPEDFDLGHDRLEEMATTGGGLFYEVKAIADLAGAYERVVADIGTVYSLSYRPTNRARDGKWRAIRIVLARPNAVARGKRGYNAN